jgi:hypothetical protein
MKVDGELNYVRYPDGHIGVHRSSEFTASNVPRAVSEQIGSSVTKASSAEEDNATLRDWILKKTVSLSSLTTELETLRKCGINDCRTTGLSIQAGQVADELRTVAGLMANSAPTTALRKSASSFSRGDRVKVLGSRFSDRVGHIGTVKLSNANETSVEFENGSMAILKTFELALT